MVVCVWDCVRLIGCDCVGLCVCVFVFCKIESNDPDEPAYVVVWLCVCV